MVRKLILAVCLAVVVTLVCILLGAILDSLKIEVATTVGNFIKTYGAAIGVIAGVFYFFNNGAWLKLP